ncbi:YgaP family membrane protein [Halobaculum lipolyticum]|uniref:DUF2892 domain-containing protein n=1 Tax=Halobaculum lipolyticum TaxID=3032001 RepID=A0ABD5WDV2_9EURY|nr:DUF2892 domain-containing protein [Halobaculum sp. DT31]
MDSNVGSTDKLARIVVGAVAGLLSLATLAGAVAAPTVVAPLAGVVAVLMLGTAFTNRCAVYSLLGISTR